MFTLGKKSIIKRALLVFVGLVLISLSAFVAIKHNQPELNVGAAEKTVNIKHGPDIAYGKWATNTFDVDSGGKTYKGMCAEPQKATPGYNDSFTAETITSDESKYQMIKLILYLFFVNNPTNDGIIDGMFQTTSDYNTRYAFVHAVVGHLNSGSTTGLNEEQVNWLRDVEAQLNRYIQSNDIVWQEASLYELNISNGGSTQNVMWIEPPATTNLTVNKVDSETNSCTERTGNLSLDGAVFELINSSNTVIQTKTISNGNCGVIFENVPLGATYTVREKTAPNGYAKDSDKTITLTETTNSVMFSDAPLRGKITVNKKDSDFDFDSESCPRTAALSFSRIQFHLVDSNNQVVDTKELTGTSCSVEFTNVLYGNYTVKEINVSNNGYNGDSDKSVSLSSASATVTFSNVSKKGSIIVRKTDSATGNCTATGNLSLAGTTFILINSTGGNIKYNGQTIRNNGEIATKTIVTNACNVTFSDLPYGRYTVREVSASTGYNADASSKEVTLSGDTAEVSFSNTSIKGKVTVNKIDADTGICTTTGDLSFDGTSFVIINDSTNAVYYNGNKKEKGQIIETKTLSNGACSVTFENLPYGDYIVKETNNAEGYMPNTNEYRVTIPTNNSVNVSTTIPNQVIRGDIRFVKMDSDNDVPMRDVLFSISAVDENNQIKETHIVVSNDEGVVDTSSSFALHSNNTNGYDALYDEVEPFFFSGYGSWFGLDNNGDIIPVNDNVGALPYGTYIIQELRCGSNLFCTGVLNQKITVTINTANQMIDLGDWDNACVKFSLGTEATDAEDGDKFIEVTGEATIKDKIAYCVKPNTDFVIKGVLMDKTTGEPLLINGEKVESSVKLRSEEDCGETEMDFTFDATGLAGKDLVVFETLYYKDDVITRHHDIDDVGQTITLISMSTYATNKATGEKLLPLNEDVEIKDVVKYCLKPGVEYTLKGILMDKKTGNGLLVESEPVEASVTFTPIEACGEVEMVFELNTTGLGGADLVVFESLYYEEELILEHKDINDTDETVSVVAPAPETGFFTQTTSSDINSGEVVYIVMGAALVGVGGYYACRLIARKRFLKRM